MSTCEHHDKAFEAINEKLDRIISRLGCGDVTLATTQLRLDHIERVVYGTLGMALLGLGGAIVNLAIK